MVANHGRDKALIAKATELTWKWFDDHKAIEPELVETTLEIAGRHADQKLFDRMHADAKATHDRDVRHRLLAAMRQVQDPKIVERAWPIALADEFESREAFRFVYVGYDDPVQRDAAYAFIKAHSTRSRTSCQPRGATASPTRSRGLCDKAREPEIEAFFKARVEAFDGGPRIYQHELEQLELLRRAQACAYARDRSIPEDPVTRTLHNQQSFARFGQTPSFQRSTPRIAGPRCR